MTIRRDILDQRNEPPLGVGIAIDVSLGRKDRPVAGQKLNVAQGPASFLDEPGCSGDEGSSPRMGRAPRNPNRPIGGSEPIYDREWSHRPTAL